MYLRLWKKLISTAINIAEPLWWPLIKEHTALHKNMRSAFLFLRIVQYM